MAKTKKIAHARRPLRTPRLRPAEAHATASRFDGGAVKLEIVFQPQSAARLTDQLVNALLPNGRRRQVR
jgi:hypothetical protein